MTCNSNALRFLLPFISIISTDNFLLVNVNVAVDNGIFLHFCNVRSSFRYNFNCNGHSIISVLKLRLSGYCNNTFAPLCIIFKA